MKKINYLLMSLVLMGCMFLQSCTTVEGKYVTSVEKDEEGNIVVNYSDQTKDVIESIVGEKGEDGLQGPKGEIGPTGEKGEQGAPGEAAKPIEFRYYKAKLWWRYENSTTWFPLVSASELDVENLVIDDFAMDVYCEDNDLSIKIAGSVIANGQWLSSEINGNTLTFCVEKESQKQYYDVTKDGEEFKFISYFEEGVNETEAFVSNNVSIDEYVGTYTLKDSENKEYVVAVTSSGSVQFTIDGVTKYLSAYGKGDVLHCFDRNSALYVDIKANVEDLSFTTNIADGEGNFSTNSEYTYIEWVDVSKFFGVYTLSVNDVEKFDFLLKANNSMSLYDSSYPRYTYSVDTVSFTVNEVEYKIKSENDSFVCSSSNEGEVVTLKQWDNVTSMLTKFSTVDADNNVMNWTVNEYGGANKDDKYFGSALQKKNVVTIAPYSGTEKLVVTYDSENATFSGVYTDAEGASKDVTLAFEAKIEDFIGNYSISYELGGGRTVQTSFEIGLNPYVEGQYAFILAGNPNGYQLDGPARTLTYTNSRSGSGYVVTANLNGTKSVTYFMLGADMKPDPASFITCTVEFTK